MKKLISVMLSIIMIFMIATPAFAASEKIDTRVTRAQIPVIVVGGDGGKLEDENGKLITTLSNFTSGIGDSDDEDSDILGSAVNILKPLILEGIATDKWDNYYDAIQNEVSDIFKEMILDKDGNAQYGTKIEKWAQDENDYAVTHDRKIGRGYYDRGDYTFWYDWRLDPIENAEYLREYIEKVKEVTGSEEISIIARCVGSNVLLAYIDKYGLDGIHGVGLDGVVCGGSDVLTDVFSGDFTVDANSINRFIADLNNFGMVNLTGILTDLLDMLDKTGAFNGIKEAAKNTIYKKLGQGVVSAIILATFSMPCYWGAVSYEKFDEAMNYVFGKEGSKKRTEYAGLIEKLTTYNETIKKNTIPLLNSITESGKKICIVSKYGIQMTPMGKNCNSMIGDQITSVKLSSFGATTSTIYTKLSDKYIQKQTELGLGKYISPDKLIDASTCLYPDYTWFVKGISHSNWTYAEDMLVTTVITADKQLTVDDVAETQFSIFPTGYWEPLRPMTEENCNTESWAKGSTIDTENSNPVERLFYMIKSILQFFKSVFGMLFSQ